MSRSDIVYKKEYGGLGVCRTVCYPCEWYGGWMSDSGVPQSNAACYFFRTKEEALAYVLSLHMMDPNG